MIERCHRISYFFRVILYKIFKLKARKWMTTFKSCILHCTVTFSLISVDNFHCLKCISAHRLNRAIMTRIAAGNSVDVHLLSCGEILRIASKMCVCHSDVPTEPAAVSTASHIYLSIIPVVVVEVSSSIMQCNLRCV